MKVYKVLIGLLSVILLNGCTDNRTPEQVAEADAKNERLYRISFAQVEIEKTLNDPDSVQYDFKGYNLDNGAMCFDYRAKNGFGGYVRSKIVVLADNSVFDTNKGYSKHCPADANYEMFSY